LCSLCGVALRRPIKCGMSMSSASSSISYFILLFFYTIHMINCLGIPGCNDFRSEAFILK
jgi:hypothetical protein